MGPGEVMLEEQLIILDWVLVQEQHVLVMQVAVEVMVVKEVEQKIV